MCVATPDDFTQAHKLLFFRQKPKRTKLRVLGLSRSKLQQEKVIRNYMALKNLKLYMKNISIQEENDKLRKKAILLRQENLTLMSQFQNRFIHT